MLYHLLISFQPQFSALNVTRYITFRTAAASMTALVDQPGDGALADPSPARFSGRPGDPAGGSGVAPRQGRHADDGRAVDSRGRVAPQLVVGRSHEHLYLDRGGVDRGVRGDRPPRRLPEDHAPLVGRTGGPLQVWTAAGGRRRYRPRPDVACRTERLQHAADLPVLQAADSRHRLALRAICGVLPRRMEQRRQPHRRSGRPGDQHVRGRRGGVHGTRLRHGPSRVRRVPACSCVSNRPRS